MTKDTLKEIGNRIRVRRKELGLSQATLAENISVSPSHMSDIENGKKNVGIKTFIRIAEELQISTDWLLRANTVATNAIVSGEISELLADCDVEESQDLFHLLSQIKRVMRKQGKE